MFDIYAAVTDRIISQMEQGTIPWVKPWVCSGGAVNHVTGRPYSLLNQILLGKPGEYVTFAKAAELGGSVRKGQKGHMVVFWKFIPKKENGQDVVDQDGNPVTIPMLRYYTVFHIDQCDGLKPRWEGVKHHTEHLAEADEMVQAYTQRTGVRVQYGSDSAYYSPSSDVVAIPTADQHYSTSEYYSTLFHELVHSTGRKGRLDRISGTAHFGSNDYSKEELVAEIGAFTLLNNYGIDSEKAVRNNAAYIQSWLRSLRNDKTMIVSACGKAEKAVKYILGQNLPEVSAPDACIA